MLQNWTFSLVRVVVTYSIILLGLQVKLDMIRPMDKQCSQAMIIPLEEYQDFIIQKVKGKPPDILQGVWLDAWICRVKVEIDPDGNVVDASAIDGDSLLADAGVAAAKEWKFRPYKKSNKPHCIVTAVGIEFENPSPGRKEDLLETAKRELELHPDSPASYLNIGYAHQRWQQYDQAIVYIRKAVDMSPSWPVAYYRLGEAYWGAEQYKKAAESYKAAFALQPDYFEAYRSLGLCLVRIHQAWGQQALQIFLKAASIARNPDQRIVANQSLASCYRDLLDIGENLIFDC